MATKLQERAQLIERQCSEVAFIPRSDRPIVIATKLVLRQEASRIMDQIDGLERDTEGMMAIDAKPYLRKAKRAVREVWMRLYPNDTGE